jgi:putative transposase
LLPRTAAHHLHFIVEADAAPALSRGRPGLAVRCARAINRCFGRRGSVWSERYHAHILGTPREVRVGLEFPDNL